MVTFFQYGGSADTEHELPQLSYRCVGLVEEMGPTDQSYRMQLPHHWAGSPLEIAVFPNGSDTAIPVSKLVKDLGVQAHSMFSPSAQCTEAANMAMAIDLHDNALLPRAFEIDLHHFIRGFSASASRIWNASLFARPRCRYQLSRANSKISYIIGKWHA